MSQKVSLRLNVKLPSAGLNGQLQRADERAIDRIHEKVTPSSASHDSARSTPVSGRQRTPHSPAVSDQFSTPEKKRPLVDSDIIELDNPIPDLPQDQMKRMREQHQHFTRNKMMTPQSKLPSFLKPVRQRPSTFPKERKLKQEKQQQLHQEALNAVLDLHTDRKKEGEDLVWNQSALQTDNEKVKRQRESIFEKFRSAPNSPLLPSFMLAAPQRTSSPSSPLASGGAPIRITSLRASGSALARMAASNVAQANAKISDLVSSTKNSVQSHRKTAKRSSLEKRAHIRQRVHVRMHQSTSPSIPSASGLSFMFTGKR